MSCIIGENDTAESEKNFGRSIFDSVDRMRQSVVTSIDKAGIKICRAATLWSPYITVVNDGVLRALLIKKFQSHLRLTDFG